MLRQECCMFLPILLNLFNILHQCSQLLCITIDNRLTVVTNGNLPDETRSSRTKKFYDNGAKDTIFVLDCYTRISIGSKLSDADIALRFKVISLTECEELCSKHGNRCNAFSFGVGVKGNGTCSISTRIPTLQDLDIHPDYDVYVKKRQDSPWCDFDYLYDGSFTFRNGSRLIKIEERNKTGHIASTSSPLSRLLPQSISLSVPFNALSFSRSKEATTNYGLTGIYDLFINHDGRFLSGDDSRRILDTLANKKNEKATSSNPFVVICHRKLQPGKKMTKLLTERVVNCENLQDCCRACAYEKSFVCKGFNYRRRTDDSTCICELTSTPYSHMDTDEDFLIDTHSDYYGREQNCLPSTWSDGSTHTLHWKTRPNVYEQSGKQGTWLNREDANGDLFRESSSSTDHSVYREIYPLNRELPYGFANGPTARFREKLHYEDPHGFASRQNDPNWNDNWRKSSKTYYSDVINEDTFPNSRINYDKEYMNVRSSTFFKIHLGDQSLQHGFSISDTNEYPREKYFNYGSAFGYNDNYVSSKKESLYEGHRKLPATTRKCSIKAVSGSKLSRDVLRKTCLARDLEQCEHLCVNETNFPCASFAYRYQILITNPTDNCLLSDLSYQDLNFYTDLEPDRDYNSYIVVQDSNICHSKQSASRRPLEEEECFSRIRSGFTIPTAITKKLLFVNDLGECQVACMTSEGFVCRSFVFKYATEYHRRHVHERAPPNCFLSDWSSEEINPVDMPDMDGAEFYERSSFSRGCEMHPLSLSILNIISSNGKASAPPIHMDELCYSEYHRPCKLMSHAIVSSTRADTKSECRQKCSTMRNIGVIPCMTFNYMTAVDGTRDNCLLSDMSMQDIRPNLDYIYDDDHMLYTWKDFDPYCSLKINSFRATNVTPVLKKHDHPLSSTLNYSNVQRALNREIPILGPIFDTSDRDKSKFGFENYQQHDLKHESGNIDDGFPLGASDFKHESFSFFHSKELSTFQRYTVNGRPCKNGTVCQRNEVGGFWSCEIEEGDYDSWDYCCEPNHRCGFSRGYHYPWCYVGLNEDQWRPCSETYYPYHLSKDRSIYRQLPTYIARHWPVIYFHEMSPPNCSIGNDDNQNFHQNHHGFDRRNFHSRK